MSTEVFVSYRREDAGDAHRLGDWLGTHFGSERIFIDVLRLKAGESFPAAIGEAISSCKAIVAVIGPHWSSGLQEDDDWVRRELREGLGAGRPIVPVLLRGATPLVAGELPGELAPLADLHALTIEDADYSGDFDDLVEVLEGKGVTPAPRAAFPEIPVKDWGEARAVWDAVGTEDAIRQRLQAALEARGLRVVGPEGDHLALSGGSRWKFWLRGGFFGPESRMPVKGRLRLTRQGAFVSVEALLVEDTLPGFNKSLGGRFESHFNSILADLRRATARNA